MLPSFIIGIACGLRAATPPAILAIAHRDRLPKAAVAAALLAGAELVGDKLPSTPARTGALMVPPRLLSGAIAGGALAEPGEARKIGALAGAAGALVGTQAGYRLRTSLARRAGRDWPIAVGEDLLAGAISLLALRMARKAQAA